MGHFARRAEPVETYVEAVVVGILSRPDAARLMQDDNRPDAEELRAHVTRFTDSDEGRRLLEFMSGRRHDGA